MKLKIYANRVAQLLRARAIESVHEDFDQALIYAKQYGLFLWQNFIGYYADRDFERLLLRSPWMSKQVNHSSVEKKKSYRVSHVMTEAYALGGHTRVVEKFMTVDPDAHVLITGNISEALLSGLGGKNRVTVMNSDKTSPTAAILKLARWMSEYSTIVLHIHPHDILATLAAYIAKHNGSFIVLYNHADHCFSFGYEVADLVAEISSFGWALGGARGIEGKQSFVGIPFEQTKLSSVKPRGSGKIIFAGAEYKFDPTPDRNPARFLNKLLEVLPASYSVTVVGTAGSKPFWQSLNEQYRHRVEFIGALPHASYLVVLSEAELYIDSFPLGNGTGFAEAIFSGVPAFGLILSDTTPLDQLRCVDEDALVGAIISHLTSPEHYWIAVSRLLASLRDYSIENCYSRLLKATEGKRCHLPSELQRRVSSNFFEEWWQYGGVIKPFGGDKSATLVNVINDYLLKFYGGSLRATGVDSTAANNITVTVGLITYNNEQTVAEAIESIFLQDVDKIDELIISDDASTDRTWDIIQDCVKKFPERYRNVVRKITVNKNEKNLGYLKNFNSVVARASGELFIYQAGDDISFPHRVRMLRDGFVEGGRQTYSLIHSDVYQDWIGERGRPPCEKSISLKSFSVLLSHHIGATEAFTPCLITNFDPIEGNTYDDLILGLRARLRGVVVYIEQPLLLYRSGGITSPTKSLAFNDDYEFIKDTFKAKYLELTRAGASTAPILQILNDKGIALTSALSDVPAHSLASFVMTDLFGDSHEGQKIHITVIVARAHDLFHPRLQRFLLARRQTSNIDVRYWYAGLPHPKNFGRGIVWFFGIPEMPEDFFYEFSGVKIWELESWIELEALNPRRRSIFDQLRLICDLVVSPSVSMGAYLHQYTNAPVVVVPDVLPLSWYGIGQVIDRRSGQQVTIGIYSDSFGLRTWTFLEGVINLALQRIPELKFVIWGDVPDTVRNISQVSVFQEALHPVIRATRWSMHGVAVALVPMIEEPERGGDRLCVEWIASGAVVLCSHVPRTEELRRAGVVVGVPNKPEDWVQALDRLVRDDDFSKTLRSRASEYVSRCRGFSTQWVNEFDRINAVLPRSLRFELNGLAEFSIDPPQPTTLSLLFPPLEYRDWCRGRSLREIDGEVLAERVFAWGATPEVLFVTLASYTDLERLSVTAASLGMQLYSGWRWMVVADIACPDPVFDSDSHLSWRQISSLDDPAVLSNAIVDALRHTDFQCCCVLIPGVYVHPHATIEILDAFWRQPNVDVVFHDHDVWDETLGLGEGAIDEDWVGERRCDPWFKPGLDFLWLLQADYIGPTVWLRASWIREHGLLPLPGAWWYDVVLRVAAQRQDAVHHVPQLLMTLPASVAELQEVARPARIVSVENLLKSKFESLSISAGLTPRTLSIQAKAEGGISIVVVVQDVYFQARESLEALFKQRVSGDILDVIIVAHRIADPDTRELLRGILSEHRQCRVIDDDGPFELARLYNRGVELASHECVLLMHVDVVPVDPEMVARLHADLALPGVAAVAPVLLKPETAVIDSAGLAPGGAQPWQVAHTLGQPYSLFDSGPWDSLRVVRSVAAVDPAVVMVRRNMWLATGGMPEGRGSDQVSMVEWALGLQAMGGTVAVTPHARAAHQRGLCASRLYLNGIERSALKLREAESWQSFWRARGAEWVAHPAHPTALSLRHDSWKLDTLAPIRWPVGERVTRPRTLGYPVTGGSGEYRVQSPLRALAISGRQYTEVVQTPNPALLSPAEMMRLQPDAVLLHQWIGPETWVAIQEWRAVRPRIRVVLGMDDRNDAVPPKSNLYGINRRFHPDARSKVRRTAQMCDGVIVSTEPLRDMLVDELGVRETSVTVIPNALEREKWGSLQPPRQPRGRPRVGWIGAPQHRGDLEFLIPVIRATRAEVDWVFMGMMLPEFQAYVKEFHRWVPFHRYPQAVAALDLDLAVAPLEINIFNECKSNLRLLEYGAAGYPVICTDITPYRRLDPPVTRLDNRVDDWVAAIRAAVADRDNLRRQGEQLREWVWRHHDLTLHVPAWDAALRGQ
jgi:glycosyltransferase involved in cell wall biosynthesis